MRHESASGFQKTVTRECIAAIAVGSLVACLFFAPPAGAQENCCQRDVYTAPFTMPAGDSEKWGGFASGDATSPLFRGTLQGTACPLEVWITGRKANPDYRFEGEVTTEGLVQTDDVGHLHGTFVAKLRLVDPDNDNALLREAKVTWRGTLTEGFNQKVYKYEPSTNSLNPSWQDRTGELGKQFFDIQDLIYNHEGKPQKCAVRIPEGNESVESGKTITINLVDVIDHQGRRPPAWQRVLVKVEKGKILNAVEKWDDFYVFKVEASGGLAVQYQAPDDCKPGKETLTVWNTCSKRKDGSDRSGGRFQLAKKEFNIVCDQWDVKITYTEDLGGTYNSGATKITVKRSYSGTFKARVKLIKTSSTTATYESRDAEVQIHDNYNHHTAREECSWRGGFNGSKGGRAPVEVELRFNTHNHTYHVGLGKWSGDGASYTLGGNLFGTSQGCSGAWQQEISSIVLPRGWEKGEGPPANRTWAPGQTSFTFQTSWDDYMTGIWPQGAVAPPPALSVMMPAAYRIVYHPLVYDWGKFPNMKIKKTLSWEITRPK
jgi:hypothetical protein